MTAKNIFFNSLLEGLRYWFHFVKNHKALVLCLYTVAAGLAVFAQYSSNHFFGLSVFSLLFPLFIQFMSLFLTVFSCLFVVPYFFQRQFDKNNVCIDKTPAFHQFFFKKFRPWIREMSKVLGASYLWGILFIIPGVIKFIQYSFVNYIVLFDPSFSSRKFSALSLSSKLTKGLVRWFLFLAASYAGLSYLISAVVQNINTGSLFLNLAGASALECLWTLWAGIFISISYHLMYLKKVQESYADSEFYEEPPALSTAL